MNGHFVSGFSSPECDCNELVPFNFTCCNLYFQLKGSLLASVLRFNLMLFFSVCVLPLRVVTLYIIRERQNTVGAHEEPCEELDQLDILFCFL